MARIASDILDHPERDKIARVLNLGLMEVDPSLHRFEPDRLLTRLEALRSLLELVMRAESALACTAELAINPHPSRGAICSAAAGCRLIGDAADCLPKGTVAGTVVLEMIRRTQEAVEPTESAVAEQ